jgi:hypothetical protein
LRKSNHTQVASDPEVHFFSRTKIAFVAKLFGVCTVVTILLVPVFLFSAMDMSRELAAVVILIFVLAFAALISILTNARTDAMFVGTCT